MDSLRNIVDDAVGDIINQADFIDQNFGGIFSNLTLLSMLLLSFKDKPFPKTSNRFNNRYDYVIVGAGAGGSVLANRLTELPCVSVLLIEAGGNAPLLTEVPSYSWLFYGSNIDWLYKTVPQKYGALSHNDNVVHWNSGKALGGGTVFNSMLYVRGNKNDYDGWEREGATGWSYKDVLPYFIKMEDNKNIDELDRDFHGQGGPMTVERPNYKPEIKEPLLEATASLGYKLTDSNGRRQTGVYDVQGTVRNQQRCSTAKAYLVPAEDRPNLTILKRAFAKKVLFRGKRAVGVEFDFEGESRRVYVEREVIISAGSVRSPQILMLSGVGPKDHLRELEIPVVVDSPAVGKNLQDHYASNVNFEISPTIPNLVVKNSNPVNMLRYITKREGPLTAPTLVTLLAFLNGLNTTINSPDIPRQELYFIEFTAVDVIPEYYNLDREVYKEVYGKYTLKPLYTCLVSLMQPYSRGEILLNSADPYDYPLIDPKYFEDERDLWDIVEGMKVCKAVGTSKPMEKVQSKMFDTVFPACVNKTANETELFACQARQLTTSIWHPVGTCRMGRRDDPRSVVDPELRVIGVSGLRVVCAAVMPIIPSGNTNVPTMMIAEKIADEMKKGIRCNSKTTQT